MPVEQHGQKIAADLKRQFALISECDLEGKAEIYFEQIERRGAWVKVVVVDVFEPSTAFDLWEQRAYLVSAARQLKLSRYCLVKCRGLRFFGLAMMGVEDYPPCHGLTSNAEEKEVS